MIRFLFIIGFDSKGVNEFFGSFENSKESQAASGGDGFDATAFEATIWAENGDEGASGQEKDFGSHPNSSHDTDDADPNNAMRKRDVSDPQRKTSRRKGGVSGSAGGSTRARTSRTVEAGMESMRVSEGDNATFDAENKERRSRTQRVEDDKDSRQRKRSTSRSKRKPRGQREARPEVAEEIASAESDPVDAERKVGVAKMAAGIRNAFNRKQSPSDP